MIANAGGCWGNWRELNAHLACDSWVGLLGVHIHLQGLRLCARSEPLADHHQQRDRLDVRERLNGRTGVRFWPGHRHDGAGSFPWRWRRIVTVGLLWFVVGFALVFAAVRLLQ